MVGETRHAPNGMGGNEAAPASGGIWCCELELSGDQVPRSVAPRRDHSQARVLVRLHGEPLGYLTLGCSSADSSTGALVAAEAGRRFAERVAAHLSLEGLEAPAEGGRPPAAGDRCPNRVESDAVVSVVVCTRDRSAELAGCLARLTALTYPHLEIIVVDNAPSDDRTRQVVAAVAVTDPRVRYVRELRPGLSRARNRGLAEARGAYVAYTDDDVAVDPSWVQGLVKGFQRRSDVGCVTGLVCTADMASAAERYFDARAASWSSRCEAQEFDISGTGAPNALYPYSPGIFGTGANFAFDRVYLETLGRFDEALGAGTRTRGGEDLDIFVRVLRGGRAIVYEPAAIVWHHHRADHDALLEQLFGYGTGLSAFIAKCLVDPETRREVLYRIPGGLRRIAAIGAETGSRLGSRVGRPKGALARELAGFAAGPALYFQSRRAARHRCDGVLTQTDGG